MYRGKTTTRTTAAGPRPVPAFTLVELLVVLAIIALIATTAVPSIVTIIASGAEAQAANLLTAQLVAARALAIMEGTHAGLHAQIADKATLENVCFTAIFIDDPATATHELTPAAGYRPKRVPGGMAFGQISGPFVVNNAFTNSVNTQLDDFTSFTIVFGPSGEVVKNIAGQPIAFYGSDPIFTGASSKLWNAPADEPGVSAVTIFDYNEARQSGDVAAYLNAGATQFCPVNVYTGQLFTRR